MSVRNCFILVFLAFFTIIPLSAATVSFLVIETGLEMDAGFNQHSGLWENGLLDVFFDSGHIVSNAPILRLEQRPTEIFPPQAQGDLDDAVEGGVEYFIVALLEFQNSGATGLWPGQVSLRLFRVQPFELLYEHKYSDTGPSGVNEERNSIRQAVRVLIPRVK